MGKLVRDKIPDLIRRSGRTPHVITLDHPAYRSALHEKLQEEVAELRAAQRLDEIIEEAADVLEALTALAAAHGATLDGIVEVATRKRADRGGFEMRLSLESID